MATKPGHNKMAMILLILMLFQCNQKVKDNKFDNLPDTVQIKKRGSISDTILKNKDLEEFKQNVKEKGDTYSFMRLILYFQEKENYKELLRYSQIMIDNYQNGNACSLAFESVIAINNGNDYHSVYDLIKINERAKNDAIHYLEQGVRFNDIGCAATLEEIYRNGIGVEKNIKKADELKRKIEKM